jgi:DNA mismatch repair protein MutL
VAQVELKTRRAGDEAGTLIEIENSAVLKQQPVAMPQGTSISMKNLFFNVPARRNFLKSNTAEMRHVVDEFIRVALSFPAIFFSLTSNGQQIFHLEAGSLKQRILQLLGNNYNTKLVAVREETDYLNIYGFVGKPDTAKKTRGDQYFFVNNRFIKSPYLNHALQHAYQDMIAADSFPMYVLFIDLDPKQVDVNVHPTKQEIKFEDEKIIYAFVQAAVKHALAQFSITPTLDFELDRNIQQLESIQHPFTEDKQSATRGTSIFQTFTEANQAHRIESGNHPWNDPGTRHAGTTDMQREPDFQSLGRYITEMEPDTLMQQAPMAEGFHLPDDAEVSQLFNTYIVFPVRDCFYLIHQQAAHERIIYERLSGALQGKPVATQTTLFPVTLDLTPADAVLLNELLPDLQPMGYTIEPLGKTAFVIQGTPADIETGSEKMILEKILEQYKHFSGELKISNREVLLRTVSWQQSIRPGVPLSKKEMLHLVSGLFQCSQPNMTASGRPTYMEFTRDQLEKMFQR